MGKDKNKEQDGETATSAERITSPQDAHQTNRDLSWERDARDATLAKTIVEEVAREMAKAHAQYQALLYDRSTAVIPTSLKVTSGANGFKVMDTFDWTKDKAIYQRWQLWSEKARLTLDCYGRWFRKDQDLILSPLDQWRGNETHWVMEKQQNPHFPVWVWWTRRTSKWRQLLFRINRKLLYTVWVFASL